MARFQINAVLPVYTKFELDELVSDYNVGYTSAEPYREGSYAVTLVADSLASIVDMIRDSDFETDPEEIVSLLSQAVIVD